AFLTEVSVGSIIKTAGDVTIGTVLTITDNTHLTLTGNAASTNAGIAYHFQGIGSGDIASIQGGHIITIDNAGAVCASLKGNNSLAGGWGLVFNAGSRLTVAGSVTVGDAGHAGSITMTSGGTLKCGSLIVTNAGVWTPGSGTVELTATNTLPASFFTSFNNLTISAGTTTTGADLTINGSLLVTSGTGNFTAAGFALTVTGTTSVGAGTLGKLTISSATGAKIFNGLVTISTGANWTNSANAPVEFHGGITNSGTFNAGTGVQIFNTNDQALTGTLSIPNVTVNGITLTNNSTLDITTSLNGTGTFSQADFSVLNIDFTGATAIAALNATADENTVNYIAAGPQTVTGTNYYNLFLGNDGAKTLQTATTSILGDFTLDGTASTTAVTGLTIGRNVLTGAGTILHAGDFTHAVAGNITNNGDFDAGTLGGPSTLLLNGSSLQVITNTGTGHIENLTTNNSGAGIQLGSAITAFTSLNMIQGNIDLNGNQLGLGSFTDKTGVLTRTAGTIVGSGSFIRWFSGAPVADGSDAGLYPLGTTTDYRPIFVSVPAGASAGGTLTVSYNDASTNSTVSIPDGAFTIVLRKDLFWTLTPGTGTLTGDQLGDGLYNIRVEGTGFGTIGDVNDLRLSLANSVAGTAGVNAGTVTNPQINRTGLSLADLSNSFFVGSVNASGTPLPVTLVSFTAYPVNGEVKLDWETSAEINNDHFTIQRSANSVSWEDVKVVAGSGNTNVDTKYSAYDENPYNGVSYYRLEQTDRDGKTSYSPIVSVKIGQSASILVYPNPATDQVRITTAGTGQLNVMLFNSNGQQLNVPVVINANSARLNVSGLQTGSYFVVILQDGQTESREIMIN
ncbi:MAG: T9SS type A sorting domain-containing protein, partial [Bacteroidota bacterium]|nr:T9SS type A sorting domain-containing protein [Bacteroidota bacterium]